MSYIGNLNGPKKSDLFSVQPPSFFGITAAELAEAVDEHITDEAAGEVAPVHVDGQGRFYLNVNGPAYQHHRMYIPADSFSGRIRVINDGDNCEKEIDIPEPVPSA